MGEIPELQREIVNHSGEPYRFSIKDSKINTTINRFELKIIDL